jgi:hypothetical protein
MDSWGFQNSGGGVETNLESLKNEDAIFAENFDLTRINFYKRSASTSDPMVI